MKFADVKGLSSVDARTKLREVRAQLFESNMQNAMGQLTDTISIRKLRRDVAKLKMVISMNDKNSGAGK